MSKAKPTGTEPNPRGELQRRVGAILDGGHDRGWTKAMHRVFHRCRQWASFDRCTFKASVRTLAKHGVPVAPSSRGITGLVAAGVFKERESAGSCRVFEIVVPTGKSKPSKGTTRSDRGSQEPWVEEE
ncbi:MAG: hypothetical protein FJ309_16940 [Planctomycetes bacterium]|nr:hypothetical protein [Planctomycetota bacterium]